jgi:uroporphyrinogen decarboxylase
MALQPEIAHAIFSHVTDFFIDHFTRLLEAANGEIDLVFTADDVAGQEGLLMSPEMWEEQIKPFHAKLNRVIHNHGARVIYHSCGSVMRLVPGFIDMGVDILNPLQFTAKNMDPATMKELHGDRVAFQGGVSVQKTLLGPSEGVRKEVEELIRVLGKGGGYILGPSHIIQLGTPPENIFTMFETALNTPLN